MRPADNIEKMIKNLNDTTSAQMDERVISDVLRALAESEKTSALTRPKIGRMIMKSPITRLATAAAIIVAAVLSINLLVETTPVAYALEQTITANHSVRYLHIKDFKAGEDEPKEFWLEFFEDGQVKSVRMHMPAWGAPEDGAKVVVWKQNKAQVWLKRKNVLLTVRDKAVADRMLRFVEGSDPRLVVQNLCEQQAEGRVEIEIEEPSNKAEPIVVTATSPPKGSVPRRRRVLSVDQATRLVTAIKSYQSKDGEYQYMGLLEFHDYNQAIEAGMFVLDEVPSDVMRIDQTTQEVGLAQGDLSDEEVVVEVARRFFTALIAGDYAGAGQLLEGMPADKMQQAFGDMKVIRIIAIGPAAPHPNPATKGLVVPCTVKIEKNGVISEWKLDRLGVRQVYNQPGRWTIFGGI
jgi:hypothetical protein